MATFGIQIITKGNSEKFTFESTDMKARAKVYELAHTHGIEMVNLFKLKKDGFEYIGSGNGIDTPANEDLFHTPTAKYGLDAKGRLKPLLSAYISRAIQPSWY